MKKVSIVIYYYITFFWWPKSGRAFDMMFPPLLNHPPLCNAPIYNIMLSIKFSFK